MLTVRVYDNCNLIATKGLDIDDFEGCEQRLTGPAPKAGPKSGPDNFKIK